MLGSIEELSKTLVLVQKTVDWTEVDADIAASVKDRVYACKGGIGHLQGKLVKIQEGTLKQGFRSWSQRMQYPFKERTLQKMKGVIGGDLVGHLDLAIDTLTFSERPLRIEELGEAVIINLQADNPFNPKERYFTPRSILRILSDLVVTFTRKGQFSYDGWIEPKKVEEIKLAHFSMKEYLVSEQISHRLILHSSRESQKVVFST